VTGAPGNGLAQSGQVAAPAGMGLPQLGQNAIDGSSHSVNWSAGVVMRDWADRRLRPHVTRFARMRQWRIRRIRA